MSFFLPRLFALVRRRPIVVISLTALLVSAAANVYLWDRRAQLAKQHDDARRFGEAMRPALASHTRLAAQVATTQEAVELIERNLVAETDLADNLGYFYKLETSSRARLAQISQLNAQPLQGNPFKSVPFSMQVIGSYPQLIAFIRALETGPRVARIKDYSFTRNDAKAGLLALDLTVEILGNK